jgi:hypothetical protein
MDKGSGYYGIYVWGEVQLLNTFEIDSTANFPVFITRKSRSY